MKTVLLPRFLENRRQPLASEAGIPDLLDELCRQAPELCANVLADATTHVSQRAQLLAGLVHTEIDLPVICQALHSLPDTDLLQVLDGLRQHRRNGRRARQLGLRLLLGHERLAKLAATHRLRLVRIFKHLLGERTWSALRRFLRDPSPEGDRFLQRVVLRFATDPVKVQEVLYFLTGLGFKPAEPTRKPWLVVPWLRPEQTEITVTDESLRQSLAARRSLEAGEGMPRDTLFGIRGTYHRGTTKKLVRQLSASQPRRERVDGPLAAELKKALAVDNGATSFVDIVAGQAWPTQQTLPLANIKAAVVVDLSSSALSSGERLYHPAALGLAMVGLLQQWLDRVDVFQVGGSLSLDGQRLVRPLGVTDLATAILQAARTEPEVIVLITDGYENLRQGDAAQVVEGIRRLERTTTVYQVVPVFTAADNLAQRRLGESIPLVPVEHESATGELMARMLLAKEPESISAATMQSVTQLLFRGVQ